ncbi:SUMF1/EgtB/PvdO family nonheme iron enzyme, partial [Pontiella sp.]|uniref:SUMF1/EgtB/PvdO family nonheme iron enzyme n=1 Tax=Pontiella sp. TaxID=2837462 RepID=UPI0035658C0A
KFIVLADDGESTTPIPVAGMVVVPAGTADGTDPDFGAYSLTMESSLYVDETETTKRVWDLVYDWAVTNGYAFDNPGAGITNSHPVTTVNWYDCVKWCNARSELEGLEPCYTVGGDPFKSGRQIPDLDINATGYRLPTGEEWEYAARAGASTRFFWGNQITYDEANYFSVATCAYDTSTTRGFHPDHGPDWPYTFAPGTFAPNGYGLYEVAGNVAEWCWDEEVADGGRQQRGGSWIDGAEFIRCGSGFSQFPSQADIYSGFRSVRDAGVSVSGTAVTLVDARDYTLAIVSLVGAPDPSAGFHIYAWGSSATCSVDPLVVVSNTTYVLKGWTGSGSIPAMGTAATTGLVPLTEPDSTIVWSWVADNDRDDLPNDWELEYYGSETGAVATADTDGDGYTAEQEFVLGTDPTDRFSQLNLTIEPTVDATVVVSCSTQPKRTYRFEYADSLLAPSWTLLKVQDGTGLVEGYEDTSGTPGRYYRVLVQSAIGTTSFVWKSRPDTDGDEMPNDWEMAFFGSETGVVASADFDDDGYTNLDEFRLGSNPTNSASHLNFSVAAAGGGGALISCSTAPGRIYIIEYTDSLSPVAWRLLGGFAGTGATGQHEDADFALGRYYRMRVIIPPGVEP